MKISIITITCRKNAGLERLALTLSANARRNPGVLVEWLVVDELLWGGDASVDLSARQREVVADQVVTVHLPPKPTRWRGPFREEPINLPDPNSARNTGLAFASGDYALFVDDHCVVTANYLREAIDCADKGRGFRANVIYRAMVGIRPDGLVTEGEEGGSVPRRMMVSQCNGVFGAPMESFRAISGFDESYAGEMGWEDLDAVERLSRTGVEFFGSRAAAVIHDTANGDDKLETHHAPANAERWTNLLLERERILPAQAQPTLDELRIALGPAPRAAPERDDGDGGASGSNGASHGGNGSFSPPPPIASAHGHALADGAGRLFGGAVCSAEIAGHPHGTCDDYCHWCCP